MRLNIIQLKFKFSPKKYDQAVQDRFIHMHLQINKPSRILK